MHFPPEKDDWEKSQKIMLLLLLMFCMLKKKKCILLIFQYISIYFKLSKASYSFNHFKSTRMRSYFQRTMALSCSKKKLSTLLGEITSKHNGDFYCSNCLLSFNTKANLNRKRMRKQKFL